MLQTGSLVRRKAEYRDSNWKDYCKRRGFKADEVLTVDRVVNNYTVYFQGADANLGGWSARYFEKVEVTTPEHHPLCDYMTSNCVEKCDCKTEWFKERIAKMEKEEASNNMVTQPKHYEFFEGVEAITVIARSMTEKQFAGYCMGNALKYRLRAGKKFNTEEDLKKADYYKELFQKHRHECIDEDI
ncbi:nucleotide kinase [Salmonella phage vB_SalP_SE29]|uniref:Nucleotide kinase n=2 Tax=Molineuxvirinae TaxID=2731650 RepID=A0A977TGP1_9CAUD|nr:hypothetical protein [Salmonella phage PST_H2]